MPISTSPRRAVDMTVFTTAGFITCKLHILEKAMVVEQIEAVPEFYNLADASIVGVPNIVEYLALQRDAVVFWVPKGEADDMLHRAPSPATRVRVFVLIDGGVVSGDLELREGVALSTFVTKQTGYILLRNCEITMDTAHLKADQTHRAAAVILNINHIVGISTEAPL